MGGDTSSTLGASVLRFRCQGAQRGVPMSGLWSEWAGTLLSRIPEMNQECPRGERDRQSGGTTPPMNDPRWRCDCGGLLDVRFQAHLDRQKIAQRKPTMWRYREALPIGDDTNIVSFDEGVTPRIRGDPGPAGLLFK